MTDYITVSFSGGKDSTAMLLHMIELGEHIDEVINVDTGMEFPAMYDHIDKIRKVVEDAGIRFTVLKADHSFEWYMLEKPIHSEKYGDHLGYGWPNSVIRWCTKNLKTKLLDSYFRQLDSQYEVICCVGIASDEYKRLERSWNQQDGHRHPLAEWGWSEQDCLDYCYSKGYDWGGLYDQFNRVSCWCCPLSTISELRNLWRYYPDLWARLEDWDATMRERGGRTCPFKGNHTVEDLRMRFEREEYNIRCQRSLEDYALIIIPGGVTDGD